MDFKKLSSFIIFLGVLFLGYGIIQYASNQPVKFDRSKSKKSVFGGRNDIGNWLNVQEQNRIREYEKESAGKVMLLGAIILFIGVGVSASATDKIEGKSSTSHRKSAKRKKSQRQHDSPTSQPYSTVQAYPDDFVDVNIEDEDGTTILMKVAKDGHSDIVKVLLNKGADVNAKDKVGVTALMLGARYGHTHTVQILLTNGANVDAKSKRGNTSLMWAVKEGHIDVVEALLDKGADIDVKNKDGHTALMVAANQGHTELVELLKEAGAKE